MGEWQSDAGFDVAELVAGEIATDPDFLTIPIRSRLTTMTYPSGYALTYNYTSVDNGVKVQRGTGQKCSAISLAI